MEAERATVLLTVKASPEIGRTHGETVCVAGVRLDGERPGWIRLFPVPWQWFWGGEHPKYQVIEVDVVKHDKGIAAGSVDISYARRGRAGRMSRCPRSSLLSSSVTWCASHGGVT